MIDPSVRINKELSNINGTVARANLKLKIGIGVHGELRKALLRLDFASEFGR
jgi:hypothetical protein